jgi:hypothetical protein
MRSVVAVDKEAVEKPYRRRYGVIWRPRALGEPARRALINDGGEDAPLTPQARRIFHWIIGGIIVVGVGLALLFR